MLINIIFYDQLDLFFNVSEKDDLRVFLKKNFGC